MSRIIRPDIKDARGVSSLRWKLLGNQSVMSLRLMPLAGKWIKENGAWLNIGDKEVKSRTLYCNHRDLIKAKCESKFLQSEKGILDIRKFAI